MPDAHRLAVAFTHVLRRSGVAVPTGSAVVFAEALAAVGLTRPEGVYWAGRSTLVHRPEDIADYDRAFGIFFGGILPDQHRHPPHVDVLSLDLERATRLLRWSPDEVLKQKDLAVCTPAELAEAHRLMSRLRLHPVLRPSRRHHPSRSRSGRPDLRRTVRRSMRTGGEVFRLATTSPGHRPRRVVLLVDVSGSMEPYARALTRFAHAAVASAKVEVFTLGTRVTRITRELSTHDPDEALRRAAAAVADWSGGTRLGEGLRHFNDRWGVRGMARGAVVVILSDGWDRGDPDLLSTETARLHRVAYRLVWVNPLKASPGYAPLAQGMAAALPHVDEFVEGHSIASLEELVKVVGG